MKKGSSNRSSAEQAPEPQVGIFYIVNGKLFVEGSSLAEAEDYAEAKTHGRGHPDFCTDLVVRGQVPLDEYEVNPRGRVSYLGYGPLPFIGGSLHSARQDGGCRSHAAVAPSARPHGHGNGLALSLSDVSGECLARLTGFMNWSRSARMTHTASSSAPLQPFSSFGASCMAYFYIGDRPLLLFVFRVLILVLVLERKRQRSVAGFP